MKYKMRLETDKFCGKKDPTYQKKHSVNQKP